MSDQLKDDLTIEGKCLPDWICDTLGNAHTENEEWVLQGSEIEDLIRDAINLVDSTPPRWTPIEDAGEWDGDVEVHIRVITDETGDNVLEGSGILDNVRTDSMMDHRRGYRYFVWKPAPQSSSRKITRG